MKKFIALTFGAGTLFLACYCTVSAQTENNKPLTHTLTQEDMDYAETIDNRIENIIHRNAVFALKPEDIIASAKLNGWSEETFEQYMSRYRQERHQLAVDLMAVLTDTNSSSETQCYAAYYLGAMRASEASEILASKIALQFSNGGVVHHFHVYPDGCYPIADDLVQIGSPAITAIIRNLAESDNSKIEELSLQAIYRIEGDKDIVQLRLQKALVAEKDAKNQARLRSAIKALADNSFADPAPPIVSADGNPKLLTQSQAETLALRLADEKVKVDLGENHPVFEQNLWFETSIQTKFVDGHWHITLTTADSHFRYYATVELASDGSTNSVVYRHEGGLP